MAGAILLDSNVDVCRSTLLPFFEDRLGQLNETASHKDAKTRLQEFLQGRRRPLPEYELVQVSGDDHNQVFRIACNVQKPVLRVEGTGGSRRKAEQAAAHATLLELKADG